MKKQFRKKNIFILLTFIFVTGILLLFSFVSKFNDKEEILVNRRGNNVSIGVGDDYDGWWEYGEWNFSTVFSSQNDYISIDESGLNLTADFSNTFPETIDTSIVITGELVDNTSFYSFSNSEFRILLPTFIFYSNIFEFTYEVDVVENRLVLSSDDTNVGYVDFGNDLPYCDYYSDDCTNIENALFYWYLSGSDIIVANVSEISNNRGSNFNFSFEVDYSVNSDIVEVFNSYYFLVRADFFEERVSFEEMSTITTTPSVESGLAFDSATAYDVVSYDSWQEEWGENVADHNYDFYLKYSYDFTVLYDGMYSIEMFPLTNGNIICYVYENDCIQNTDNYSISDIEGDKYFYYSFIVGYNLEDDNRVLETNFYVDIQAFSDNSSGMKDFEWYYLYEKIVEDIPEEPEDPIIKVEYPSGYNKKYSHTLMSDDAGISVIDKIRNDKKTEFEWKIEPITSDINQTNDGYVKAFNLWNLTQLGTVPYTFDLEVTGAYIDSSYNSVVSPLELTNNEYVYKSFYLLDDIEYDYVLNDSEDSYVLQQSELNTYTGKFVYAKISNGEYELLGSISKNVSGNIVYVASDSRTTHNDNVTKENPIILPDNVTDIKVQYVGLKAAVYFGIGVTSELSTSEQLLSKVNNLVSSNSNVVLKNEAKLTVSSVLESTKLIGTYLTLSYETSTNFGSDSVVNGIFTDESNNKYNSITYKDYVYEQIEFASDGNSTDALDYFNEQKDVIIYELLPLGAELDGDVTVKTYGNDVDCAVVVESTDNYDGTGRTLLKINVTGSTSNVYQGTTYLRSGYNISFDIKYDNLAVQSYGNNLYKDMAYYSDDVLTNGFVNAREASSSYFSSSAIQNTMAKLDETNTIKNSIYNTEVTTVEKVTVTVGTYVKEVKNSSNTNYSNSTNVIESMNYKYRLKYVFASDYEEITNLIFVDKLESDYGNNKYFKGYLDSIDTSYLDSLGINSTIYYSTNIDVDLSNVDLTDGSWSTTKPNDSSKIVAIAVSCGSYLFKGSDDVTPMIDINMIATNEYSEENAKSAYNSSFINYNYLGDAARKRMVSEVVTVLLDEAPIEISATTSATTSNNEDVSIVEDELSYIISITNSDTSNQFNNIEFDLTIPEGLTIKFDDITEISDNNNALFGEYNFDENNRVLTYSFDKLLANENKEITIPVEIDFESLSKVEKFTSKVQMKKLGGNNYNSEIISLSNKLAVPYLEYAKYVDTLDTDGYTDEATVIIERGETYSYKVNISNTSSIDAKNILVVDNVPVGLSVLEDSITNNGIYDDTTNTITWNIDKLSALNEIDLLYNVVVSDDIELGTVYRSSAHVSLENPIDNNLMLYDDDTNIVSTLYQIVSNIKVSNNVSGLLADLNKQFKYEFEFEGDASVVGTYSVFNKNNKVIGTLSLDENGKGTYSAKLKASESLEFKLLPNGIKYTIKQYSEEGYTSISDSAILIDNTLVINGVTNEEKQVNYTYNNSYSVSTTVDISGEVTYDKDMTSDMFALTITDTKNVSETKYADEFGIVNFETINYDNVEGTFKYTVVQENTKLDKVSYDTNMFTVVVTVINDGKGHLNSNVKYYNKLNEEVDDIIFNNLYIPNGLIINNVNTSDYVDTNKIFKYKLEVTDSVAGSYLINNTKGEKIGDLVIDDTGAGTYEFELLSEERITVLDLPIDSKYTVTQELANYYTTIVDNLTYTVDVENNVIIHSGVILDSTIQIDFNNNYVTSGTFTPSGLVKLIDGEMVENEFTFMLKDISKGLTNGYVEYVTNTLDGNLNFTTIEYNRPGTYVYEITQVKGDSNHILYDLDKCILTVTLIDNGDSTMTLESSLYEYSNGKDYFENRYSIEPIIPPVVEEDKPINNNPNTSEGISKFVIVIGMFIIVLILFVIEKVIRKKRLSI